MRSRHGARPLHRVVSLVIHELPMAVGACISVRMRVWTDAMWWSTTPHVSKRSFAFATQSSSLGLTDCQARDKRKLEFAFNSSFTALNVAKIMCKELGTSIGRLKAKMNNAYYAQRIIDVFEKSPNTPLNKERINDI